MKFRFFLFVLFVCNVFLAETYSLNYEVLQDNKCIFENIVKQNLPFKKNDYIFPNREKTYWFKLSKKEIYALKSDVYLNFSPDIDLTFYEFDYFNKKWNKTKKGKVVANKNRHNMYFVRYLPSDTTALFVKLKTNDFGVNANKFKPEIYLELAKNIEEKEQLLTITWICTLVIISLSILNIFLDYTILKEKTHVYYILVLLGCLIYVTSFHRFFNLFTSFRLFKSYINSVNKFNYLDFNGVMTIFSLMIIISGLTLLTSKFLSLKKHFPKYDKLIKRLTYFFFFYSVFSQVITIFSTYYYQNQANKITNVLIMIIISLNLFAGFKCLKYENRNAKIFIIANLAPFIIIILSAFYLIFTNYQSYNMIFLPYLGMIVFSISFSFAISIRTRNTNVELLVNELKNKSLVFENEKINLQKNLIEAERKELESKLALEKAELVNLQLDLDYKHREMVSSSLHISQKNELLDLIKKELAELSKSFNIDENKSFSNINNIINSNKIIETNWENFKIHFEQVHPNFFEELLSNHPNLTPNELRLSAYLKLNLTNKEIATIQNIDPNSVKRAKIRLNAKLKDNQKDKIL